MTPFALYSFPDCLLSLKRCVITYLEIMKYGLKGTFLKNILKTSKLNVSSEYFFNISTKLITEFFLVLINPISQ